MTAQAPRRRLTVAPDRRSRLVPVPDTLFCYGTLQFDAVLEALLGRIPSHTPASAPGWRAAALEGLVYPGLVASAVGNAAEGVLLTDLSNEDWKILDVFEDTRYDLREVTLSTGQRCWAYIWAGEEVRPKNWDAAEFQDMHLQEYAARCARIGPRLIAGLPKGK